MRPIDADRALEIVRDQGIAHPNAHHLTNYATLILREAPTIDVAPVRHGRWILGKDLPYDWGKILKNKYHLYCSECLEQAFNRSEDNDPDFDVDTPYCPNCGAKMDLPDECKQDGERQ